MGGGEPASTTRRPNQTQPKPQAGFPPKRAEFLSKFPSLSEEIVAAVR